MDRRIERLAFLAQTADIGNHHQAVQHSNAAQGDEAHCCRNGKGNVTQPQGDDAPGQGERDARKHQQSVLDVAKHGKEQHKDKEQSDGYDDLQTCRG